jgi:hypothetical protein
LRRFRHCFLFVLCVRSLCSFCEIVLFLAVLCACYMLAFFCVNVVDINDFVGVCGGLSHCALEFSVSGRPALSLSIHSVYMLANILDRIYDN